MSNNSFLTGFNYRFFMETFIVTSGRAYGSVFSLLKNKCINLSTVITK